MGSFLLSRGIELSVFKNNESQAISLDEPLCQRR